MTFGRHFAIFLKVYKKHLTAHCHEPFNTGPQLIWCEERSSGWRWCSGPYR